MKRPEFYQQGDQFPVLDLIASFSFKTAGSIFFDLVVRDDQLGVVDGVRYIDSPMYRRVGLLDVHYPREGFIKAHVRVLLPEPYHSGERLKELVAQVFYQLAIPADETYEAELYDSPMRAYAEQVVDRNGMTDRIYSTHDGP
jgi:hypothetical protein